MSAHSHSSAVPYSVKPQSHRIVRFLDRTIGCDWAKVRPIGIFCYDPQQRSHTAIDLYAWSRYHEEPSQEIVRLVVVLNDRCTINRSLPPATDSTSNRGIL